MKEKRPSGTIGTRRKATTDRREYHERTNRNRFLMVLFAVFGTLLYVASFALLRTERTHFPLFMAIGVAAAVSWVVWGPILLTVARSWHRPTRWIDASLLTMTAGMTVLMIGALLNFLQVFFRAPTINSTALFFVVHLGIIAIADGVMWVTFKQKAIRRGIRPTAATGLWITLNVLFVVLLLVQRSLGVWP